MSLPRTVRAVAFDMDGLLVDTERVYHDVMIAVAKELGSELTTAAFLRMIGTPRAAANAVMYEACGKDFDLAAFDDEVERRVAAAEVSLKAGVAELLDALDTVGVPFALVTNNSRAAIEASVGRHGLIGRFRVVVFGGEAPRGKPAPDPFLLAADRLGVDPADCLALEDSHNGVRAAHAAGMMTIMVPDMLEATEEMRELALRVEETLHDVRRLLIAS